jgi:hypothetical protein
LLSTGGFFHNPSLMGGVRLIIWYLNLKPKGESSSSRDYMIFKVPNSGTLSDELIETLINEMVEERQEGLLTQQPFCYVRS